MVKDREAWHAAVHGFAKSWTPLNDDNRMHRGTEALNEAQRDSGRLPKA